MKFATVEGQKREAFPGASGACPSCGGTVIAKCGEARVWHWAHKGARVCDQWWEPETEWHRNWKNEFPADWQEVIHMAPDGERHIADVKTTSGRVIEFQHSFLKAEERMAREAFYGKIVWVVDGCRRKRDVSQFQKCIGPVVFVRPAGVLHVIELEDCALLRDWKPSSVPVYFDLGLCGDDGKPTLWLHNPTSRNGRTYLTPLSRDFFLKAHREGLDFEEDLAKVAREYVQSFQRPQPLPQTDFPRFLVRRRHRL